MATTRQHAFRLSPGHEKIIEEHARRLGRDFGFTVSNSDALRAIVDSFGRIERIREQRVASYRKMLAEPGPGQDRARVQQALDDWLSMSHERMMWFADQQARGLLAAGELQRDAAREGLDRLSEEEIQGEIAAVRRSRKRS